MKIEFFEVREKIERYNDLLALSQSGSANYERIEVIIKTLKWEPGKDVDEIKSEIGRYNNFLNLAEVVTHELHLTINSLAVRDWLLEQH